MGEGGEEGEARRVRGKESLGEEAAVDKPRRSMRKEDGWGGAVVEYHNIRAKTGRFIKKAEGQAKSAAGMVRPVVQQARVTRSTA